ncbi:smad nuclear-interacting protein 1 isoform X2 [Rhinatrema bivittatum]|uniref:smad nuclear-interacting protein 1 isoform X2 n=1 Tax=Rhinatrema bivittatum TaxID=194408 RepID=UPI001127E890|nr:smad nuclear-interacting protein 1 isoform X2 [Rhinatrema bivittatum]
MKELKGERKAKKRKKRRRESESPPRASVAVKVERMNPARPQRSESPEPRRKRSSGSPAKRKNKSSVKRNKSPRYKRNSESRSRSPPHIMVKVKQEREEYSHIRHEERQHRNGSQQEHRRERHREESNRGRHPNQRHGGQERSRDRETRNLQEQREEREFYNERRQERRQRNEMNNNNDENQEFESSTTSAKEKELPNFELSGALLEDTNTFRGVVIKYSEPPEARIPKKRWRLYPFKNDEVLPVMYIHRQSAYLLGRQRRIADIPIDHPSCSKQHAVLQYRLVEYSRADGTTGRRVKPYIIDLGSGNGTYLNNQRIEPQRYYELKEKDVLKFGFSSREYVVLHESSDTSEVDKKPEEEEDDEGMDERTES